MVVDDDVFNLSMLEMLITKSFSEKPFLASNGKIAVEVFEETFNRFFKFKGKGCAHSKCHWTPLEIIFMDINMPVMDGIEATKRILRLQIELRIKAIEQGLKPPKLCQVFAVTAFSSKKLESRCQKAGI